MLLAPISGSWYSGSGTSTVDWARFWSVNTIDHGLHGLCQPDRPLRGQNAVRMIQRTQHQVRCIAMQAIQRHVEINLL